MNSELQYGISVAVVADDRVSATEVSGPGISPGTRFQAASISKIIGALTAVRLAEAGQIELDGPVAGQLRHWQLPDPGRRGPTVRQLLLHRAGVNVSGVPGYHPDAPIPTLLDCLEGRAGHEPVAVTEEPGEFRYSGGGYAVLQLLVEEVCEEPYSDVARRLVLEPLDLHESGFVAPDDYATAHTAEGAPLEGGYRVYPEEATAGLWSTPRDLALLVLAVQRGEAAPSGELERLLGSPGSRGIFGMVQGEPLQFWHPGSNDGYRAMLFGYVEPGPGAAVMVASDAGADVIDAQLARIAQDEGWPGYVAPA